MIIALDYDDCFTRDPIMWHEFIVNARAAGHIVYGVTMRMSSESASMNKMYLQSVNRVVYTSREGKRKFCAEHDIFPHVWIDDTPEFIVNGIEELKKQGKL